MIVISRHRPRELARCLGALTRQSLSRFEVILVADPGSLQTRPDLPVKRVGFDLPNVSAARNAGLAVAAGEVVLFVDDDAIPEPCWARLLSEAFADTRVVAATGFTRGPDGLGWQVRAERVTPDGYCEAIDLHEPRLFAPDARGTISTIGTNCAFRRDALMEIGGFDPAFSYFLDESDVNMRLAARFPQGLTAVIPRAEVIHGLAPGTSRKCAGVPWDLTAIGRSTAYFAARHGGSVDWLRPTQRRRLLRLMLAGRLDPFAVAPLLATLEKGIAEAGGRVPPDCGRDWAECPGFLPFPTLSGETTYLAGWVGQRAALRSRAAEAVARGHRTCILLMSPTFLPHRRIWRDEGWWEQVGGLWGRSQPGDRTVMFMRREARILRERAIFAAMQH